LDAELKIDPEPVKQTAAKEQARPSEPPASKPAVSVNNGSTNLDDIEYADVSEERVVDFQGYTNLVEETPSLEKPDSPLAVESPGTVVIQVLSSSERMLISSR